MNDQAVLDRIESDYGRMQQAGLLQERAGQYTQHWSKRMQRSRKLLFNSEGRLNHDAVRNFARHQLFITDNPRHPIPPRALRWLGRTRGEVHMMETLRRALRETGYLKLLKKYPRPSTGAPLLYRTGPYAFTHRWAKNIHHLGRVNEFLAPHLPGDFVACDIGAGRGCFSGLLRQEYPASHHVLVEIPEQLLLARYYLEVTYPGVRVAGIGDLPAGGTISRDWIAQYDFVLLPWPLYDRLERGSVDLITSFAALGEFTRPVFEFYTRAPVFRGARYIYSSNPVRADGYFKECDITILDYPMRREDCLHIGLSPVFRFMYSDPTPYALFFYTLRPFNAFLEYIGRMPGADPEHAAAPAA